MVAVNGNVEREVNLGDLKTYHGYVVGEQFYNFDISQPVINFGDQRDNY